MKDSPLKNKSEKFADRVVKLYSYLRAQKKEFIISKQILRSGMSIGANVSEANFASSGRDFMQKLKFLKKNWQRQNIGWIG